MADNFALTSGRHRVKLDATGGLAQATYLLGNDLPNNAMITRAYYTVTTTFTSGTDAATIGVGIETDDVAGCVAATAISAGTNSWDAGNHECIQDGTAANFGELTAAAGRQIEIVVAGGEDLTAGVAHFFFEYVIVE
jgi:hypothetical protein